MTVFNALKKHKYKHPLKTINFMQQIYNHLRLYKKEDDDSDNDEVIRFTLVKALKKNSFFVHH